MSRQVDALIIVGHSHLITQEAPRYAQEDIGIGLEYVWEGRTKWHDGSPITEEDKSGLYAGEVFIELGSLAANRYMQQSSGLLQRPNPFREVALAVIDEISPFKTGEILRSDFAIEWPHMKLTDQQLPEMFNAALTADPSIKAELKEKWGKAQAVHTRRGTVAIMAYDADTLLESLGELKIDEIAPDEVTFYEDLSVAVQSYNLSDLVGRTGITAEPTEVPYYQTFSNTSKNELEILTAALEDLRLVSKAIA